VGQVAHHLGHDWLLCELNADYLPLIESRIKTLPRCLVKPDAPKRAPCCHHRGVYSHDPPPIQPPPPLPPSPPKPRSASS
jgi:hypothetical protein